MNPTHVGKSRSYLAFDVDLPQHGGSGIAALHQRDRDAMQERDRVRRGAECENHDLGDEDR